MRIFLLQFLTWWNGQTLGTRFFTWRNGERVGEDDEGNVYYKSAKGKRWVIYNGDAEASRIPAGWHGWMHYRTDTPPSEETYQQNDWEIAHRANQTGSAGAYRPRSATTDNKSPSGDGDYQAWTP